MLAYHDKKVSGKTQKKSKKGPEAKIVIKLPIKTDQTFIIKIKTRLVKNRSTVAQMAARSPHDRKVVGSNPAGSYETRF